MSTTSRVLSTAGRAATLQIIEDLIRRYGLAAGERDPLLHVFEVEIRHPVMADLAVALFDEDEELHESCEFSVLSLQFRVLSSVN